MEKLLKILKSRTVWSGVAVVLVNGVPAVKDLMPPDILPIVNSVLGFLAIYFRINVKADLR